MQHNLNSANVLIIGDVMLDSYWRGDTSRISPEAPVPVVQIDKEYAKAGGAGNVARNITSLGGNSTLLSITGKDEAANTLRDILENSKVTCDFIATELPTIRKLRVLSRNQQLIRLDFERGFAEIDKSSLIKRFQQALKTCNAVVISDYGKGTLSDPQELIAAARKLNKPVLVDPKGSDFKKYQGASIITPNISEFQEVVGNCADEKEIVSKGKKLAKELNVEALLVTRGADGMSLIYADKDPVHIPTRAKDVFDVTGAGDTVIATMAMAIAADHSFEHSMQMANAAAGVVVGKVGTATVTEEELEHALGKVVKIETGVTNLKHLRSLMAQARANGEKVVMTNGCFDILHAGHVDYLNTARNMGDRLIIAVNDDDSVKRLKGDSRPINPIEFRMELLASLKPVDWVIPFSDDTPAKLIADVLPDILVKGADYEVHEIAGSDVVLANGGQVKTVSLKPGCSTTNIIKKALGTKK